jgi:hypothetical protein
MRITVDLSEPTYSRLQAAAAERGSQGLSPIVEEALRRHFEARHREVVDRITAAEGAWGGMDLEAWEQEVADAWATWRLPPP